jgi:hypothetical protein
MQFSDANTLGPDRKVGKAQRAHHLCTAVLGGHGAKSAFAHPTILISSKPNRLSKNGSR